MRYLRLFAVSFLLTIALTGCHHRQVRTTPPRHAQAPPIVSTLPPIPPRTLSDVEQAKTVPAKPAPPPPAPAKPAKKQVAKKSHRRKPHKPEPSKSETGEETPSTANSAPAEATTTTPAPKAAVLGQLSAADTSASPDEKAKTRRILQRTENRLKKLSAELRAAHKDDIAQVESFLKQAQQAWSMNDLVGAQTLANKAKILLDDLSK